MVSFSRQKVGCCPMTQHILGHLTAVLQLVEGSNSLVTLRNDFVNLKWPDYLTNADKVQQNEFLLLLLTHPSTWTNSTAFTILRKFVFTRCQSSSLHFSSPWQPWYTRAPLKKVPGFYWVMHKRNNTANTGAISAVQQFPFQRVPEFWSNVFGFFALCVLSSATLSTSGSIWKGRETGNLPIQYTNTGRWAFIWALFPVLRPNLGSMNYQWEKKK